jgi:hypothetical protein
LTGSPSHAGETASAILTFHPDHSMRAGQDLTTVKSYSCWKFGGVHPLRII